jgi:predicted DNA-binding transcriptional regulator YafY
MAEDLLVMSKTERLKKAILASVKEGHFNLREAAERLELSKRQVRRRIKFRACFEASGRRNVCARRSHP